MQEAELDPDEEEEPECIQPEDETAEQGEPQADEKGPKCLSGKTKAKVIGKKMAGGGSKQGREQQIFVISSNVQGQLPEKANAKKGNKEGQ